jgi:DNA processing protein
MDAHLKNVRNWRPPWDRAAPTLWLLGDPPARLGIAVVGARASDPYGLEVAARSAHSAVTLGYPVVSGGAEGCDRAAHEATLAAGGQTIVVLAGGLDRPYPAAHRDLFGRIVESGGALVTAYPPGTPPRPHRFLERNHLIASLCVAVVVARARSRSGALTTARAARDLGRPVLAVPGPVGRALSSGGHALLESGALPMTGGRSLSRALHAQGGDDWPITNHGVESPFERPEKEYFDDSVTATPEGEELIEVLRRHDILDLAGFSRLTKLPTRAVMALLVELEIAGAVTERHGYYRLCKTGCSASGSSQKTPDTLL